MNTGTRQSELSAAVDALSGGRTEEAIACLERVATAQTGDAQHWQGLLDIASRIGDDDLALVAARQLHALAPRDVRRRAVLVDWLSETGRGREALAITRRLLEENPRNQSLPLAIGIQLGRLGREDEALSALRVALRRSPHSGLAWENLANLKTFRAGDPDIAELERLARVSGEGPDAAAFAFALGKAYDDIGDVDRAFEWFVRGNSRVLGNRRPRMESLFSDAAAVQAAFPPPLMDAAARTDRTERPVVIIGCPRSGTTLLERILATAPGAVSGGELKMLRLACLGFSPPSPARVARFTDAAGGGSSAWQRVAETYTSRLRMRFGQADGVLDKGLVNYLYIGALALALPNARVIHVRRDPMDVAWSCYRRRFHEGLDWSYHFESIAAFLRVYADTAEYWKRLLPGWILTVDYERLVSDPDPETAAVFAHSGLERPADWRSFHERRGVVLTASQLQVRRPLNDSGLHGWRRYERHLGPLRDALRRQGLPVEPVT